MNMNGFVVLLVLVITVGIPSAIVHGAGAESARSTAGGTAKAETASLPSAGDVLARVNGINITRGEVDRTIRIFLAQSRVSHNLSPDARKQAEAAALEQLIGAKLLYQAGRALKIEGLDGQVAEKIARARSKFSSPAAYDAALQADGLTGQEAQDLVRNDIVAANLIDRAVVDKIIVLEADIRGYYDQNQEKFTKPAGVRLSHILIGVDPRATPEERRKAREKAESIREKILGGADFATIATRDSSCPSKEQGGDLGFFGTGEIIPEFEAAVALLEPGGISRVVETDFGYHILKLVEKKNAIVGTFDETKEEIREHLKQTRAQKATMDYLAELKKKATIEMAAAHK